MSHDSTHGKRNPANIKLTLINDKIVIYSRSCDNDVITNHVKARDLDLQIAEVEVYKSVSTDSYRRLSLSFVSSSYSCASTASAVLPIWQPTEGSSRTTHGSTSFAMTAT